MIDFKVFERYFKELNKETPTEKNVILEESCDWIIFVKFLLTSKFLGQKQICLIDKGKEDKNDLIDL